MKAVEEPPSLVDLRHRTTAMLPRVDLPEVVLEVMSWVPGLAGAFTAVSGGRSRLEDLPLHRRLPGRALDERRIPADRQEGRARPGTLAAVARVPELLPSRDPAPANAPLVARQAGLPLAQAWGGGLVASVDGMRFVVPVPTACSADAVR